MQGHGFKRKFYQIFQIVFLAEDVYQLAMQRTLLYIWIELLSYKVLYMHIIYVLYVYVYALQKKIILHESFFKILAFNKMLKLTNLLLTLTKKMVKTGVKLQVTLLNF